VILLPLVSGLTTLAILLPGLPQAAWPLFVGAVVFLGLSAWGRWPATGTAFCATVVGLAVIQDAQTIWMDIGLGLLLGVYLLMVEANESIRSLKAMPEWVTEQPLRLLAVSVGVAAVTTAVSLPVAAALPAVIVGGAAAAMVFGWAVPTDEDDNWTRPG
jgi:hypothetical protein